MADKPLTTHDEGDSVGATNNVAPVLPAIIVGKYDSVLNLLTELVDHTQKVFVEKAEKFREETRGLSTRPLDIKDAGQLVAGMAAEDNVTLAQKAATLKKVMGEGYQVEEDPTNLGVWVLSALEASRALFNRARMFVLLVEMPTEEFVKVKESTGWFDDSELFELLEKRATSLMSCEIDEFRERFIAAINHAAKGLTGDADPKALLSEVLGNLGLAWGQALAAMRITRSESYLTDSPASTGGPPE